jgi:hypothetical protein
LVLAQQRRLDWLAWAVPALTLAAAAVLFGAGAANTTRVRPTIASWQLWRLAPQTGEAKVDGLAAIYDQGSREILLQAKERAWMIADPLSGAQVHRHVWTDGDGERTQNDMTSPGGIHLATVVSNRQLSRRVGVQGQFGPSGLTGKLEAGELQDVSDLVIVSPPAPALAVTVASDGTFIARPEQVLAADQYTASALLSDEQRRRQDVLRKFLDPADALEFPRQTSLLFWCRPPDAGVTFPEGFDIAGSALALAPLELRRTPPKSSFQLPATFLPVSLVPSKSGISNAYNPRTGEWVTGLTIPTEAALRFALPEQVLPCRLERGVLTVRVNAPSRELSLWAHGDSQPVLVRKVRNPNGVLQFDLGEEHLALDPQGGVTLTVAISTTLGSSNAAKPSGQLPGFDNTTWQIDYVRLTVAGKTE